MTAEIITTQQDSLQAVTLPASAFSEFMQWIDRTPATAKAYLKSLKQFAAWLDYSGITAPTREDIIKYRDYLTADHERIRLNAAGHFEYQRGTDGEILRASCKPTTAGVYLQAVKRFFSWTADRGIYPDIARHVHGPKITHDTHKRDALTPEQAGTIEQTIRTDAAERTQEQAGNRKDTAGRVQRSTEQGARLYAMYLLAVTAGLRTVELSRANVKDIEPKGAGAVMYVWGKGHAEPDQRIILAPEVWQAIREYLQMRTAPATPESPLFVATGNRSGGKRIAPCTISKMLKRAIKAAGYDSPRLTAHSLRHTAGTTAQEITGNIYETQRYMRHSDPKTTEIYIHDGEQAQEQAAELAESIYKAYQGGKTPQRTRGGITAEQRRALLDIVEALRA